MYSLEFSNGFDLPYSDFKCSDDDRTDYSEGEGTTENSSDYKSDFSKEGSDSFFRDDDGSDDEFDGACSFSFETCHKKKKKKHLPKKCHEAEIKAKNIRNCKQDLHQTNRWRGFALDAKQRGKNESTLIIPRIQHYDDDKKRKSCPRGPRETRKTQCEKACKWCDRFDIGRKELFKWKIHYRKCKYQFSEREYKSKPAPVPQ